MKNNFKKAFTLIEILVVISIIGIIISISVLSFTSTEEFSRNTARLNDVKQIQLSLEEYYKYENSYPDTLNFGGSLVGSSTDKMFLAMIPKNPSPRNDGSCLDQEYQYSYNSSTKAYTLSFCLSKKISDFEIGNYNAVPAGILKVE